MNLLLKICITFCALALLIVSGASLYERAEAQERESRAGLVVQFADGSVQTFCITFAGESITGLDMLVKTGLPLQVEGFGGMGAMVCKIGNEGCNYPDQPCVCQSYGPGGKYWTYHHLREGRWRASTAGAGSYRVRDGDIEGWAWSEGSPPALQTFDQLCAPLPQPSPTLQLPTATRQPQPTATQPVPTSTPTRPRLSATPQPSATLQPVEPTLPPAPPEPEPTGTSTPISPTNTATAEPSSTPTTTAEPTGTPTPDRTNTPGRTVVPTGTPSPTPIPTPVASSPGPQVIGLMIGGVTLLGLALWALVRRPTRQGGSRVD